MPKSHNFTEEQEKRIIEIYNGQGKTLEGAALKASDELGEEITLGSVRLLLKKKGIPRKKKGRSGISHENHFHGIKDRIYYKSLTEEMKKDIIDYFNSSDKRDISIYSNVNTRFKERYGKRLDFGTFEKIVTGIPGMDLKKFRGDYLMAAAP